MRIWIGEEKEGTKHKGEMTMFVEGANICGNSLSFITSLLGKPCSAKGDTYGEIVKRIYFGAGKVEVIFLQSGGFKRLLDICETIGIGITLETVRPNTWFNNPDFLDFIGKHTIEIVIRTDIIATSVLAEDALNNVTYKVDTGKSCFFTEFQCVANNSIEEVKDGMYECDQLIFSDYKGEKKQ